MAEEIYKDIPGYEGIYQASNLGNVRSYSRETWNGKCFIYKPGRVLKRSLGANGYYVVAICVSGKQVTRTVHSLVAATFLSPVNGRYTVNHKDGDKTNNCSYNLEYASYRDNNVHALNLKLRKRKIQASDVPKIKMLFALGETKTAIANKYSVNIKTIDNVLKDKLLVCELNS